MARHKDHSNQDDLKSLRRSQRGGMEDIDNPQRQAEIRRIWQRLRDQNDK